MSDQILRGLHLELVQGDDYLAADSRNVAVIGAGARWPTTVATVKLVAVDTPSGCCEAIATVPVAVIDAAGTYTAPTAEAAAICAFDLAHAVTQILAKGVRRYMFEVRAVLDSGSVVTLASGHITVT